MPGPDPAPARPAAPDNRDWPAQAADSIVELVDTVRAKTTDRVITGARGVVFGLLIAAVAAVGLMALLIGLIRLTQVMLVNAVQAAGGELSHERAVWISYLVVGMVLVLVGSLVWRLANRQATKTVQSLEEQA